MALESDVVNADGRLAIKFYKHMEEDVVRTQVEGRPVYRELDYIQISVPGDTLNERHSPVYENHKQRFPIQWANYMNRQGAEGKFEGTPLSEWPLITRTQAEELKAMKFYTVEQVAGAGDQSIMNIGMAAGMSPYAFRDKAKLFLDSAKTSADFTNREQEISTLKAENARIKAETNAMMKKMQEAFDEKFSSLLAAVGEKKQKAKPTDKE